MMLALGLVALVLALLPAVVAAANLILLRTPPAAPLAPGTLVSILIPARNEAMNIDAALDAALATVDVPFEIVVMDDGSTDETPAIVRRHAARDSRVCLVTAPPLPEGWTGKVHACHNLSLAAKGTHLLFVDADVRLAPQAAASLASHAERTGAALVSAVPRQEMRSLGELLTVPSINFLLLGYLPFGLMRVSLNPGLGAACGQLMMAKAEPYRAVGGHGAIRHLLHDGIQMARLFRRAGHKTDIVAGADLATCRMYRTLSEAWAGFSKNAHEGMATPTALPVWSLLLFGGHVLPALLAVTAALGAEPAILALLALAVSLGTRAAVTLASREPLLTIPLHPAGMLVALAIQWAAFLGVRRGQQAGWKGRLYPAS